MNLRHDAAAPRAPGSASRPVAHPKQHFQPPRSSRRPAAPRRRGRAAGPAAPPPSELRHRGCRMARTHQDLLRVSPCSTTSPSYMTTTSSAILRDDAQIVGDEQDGHLPCLQIDHQLQDLRLDGDVQRRGRLVRDQQQRRAARASAIAIIARCRSPPDSSNGYVRSARTGSGNQPAEAFPPSTPSPVASTRRGEGTALPESGRPRYAEATGMSSVPER